MKSKHHPKHILDSAIVIALDTGDYHETQHAIKVLDDEARITDGGKETAAEVAARVLAREVIRLEREEKHLLAWRHDVSTALKTGHPSATELMYSQHAAADLRERAARAEEERDRLRDKLRARDMPNNPGQTPEGRSPGGCL